MHTLMFALFHTLLFSQYVSTYANKVETPAGRSVHVSRSQLKAQSICSADIYASDITHYCKLHIKGVEGKKSVMTYDALN